MVEGEVTVFAGKSGWGKTTLTALMVSSCAVNQELAGDKIWGGPHKVLWVSSEDDVPELSRRFIGYEEHYKIALTNVLIRGTDSLNYEPFTCGSEKAPQPNEAGFVALEYMLQANAETKILVLDPLSTFCPVGINNNGLMAQVMLRLKRLGKQYKCSIVIVHHTIKNADLTNVDAIGGASAIVNQARIVLLRGGMTEEEASQFKGVRGSELHRYLRVLDGKINMARSLNQTIWYEILSQGIGNGQGPVFPNGDHVQVARLLDPLQLHVSPVAPSQDVTVRRVILDAAANASPPFSPSARGGSGRHILPAIEPIVEAALTGKLKDKDLRKFVEGFSRSFMVRALFGSRMSKSARISGRGSWSIGQRLNGRMKWPRSLPHCLSLQGWRMS